MSTEGSVADRLKLARKAREYTQGELAGLISCSRNTLSAAENGKSVLSARMLHAVSEKLWISEDWLRCARIFSSAMSTNFVMSAS